MKQIDLALMNFHDGKKFFPSAVSNTPNTGPGKPTEYVELGYIPYILPHMEFGNLFSAMDMKTHWQDDPNLTVCYNSPLPQFRCPSQDTVESTFTDPPGGSGTEELTNLRSHYHAVMGAKDKCPVLVVYPWPTRTYTMYGCGGAGYGGSASNGVMYPTSKVSMKDVTDGTSHTFLVGEISWNCGPQRIWSVGGASRSNLDTYVYTAKNVFWPLNTAFRAVTGAPASGYNNNDLSFGSNHPGGCHFAMCDGSVQFIREDITIDLLRAFASRKSGETIDAQY